MILGIRVEGDFSDSATSSESQMDFTPIANTRNKDPVDKNSGDQILSKKIYPRMHSS